MRACRDVLNDNVRLSCPREKSIEDLRPGTWRVLRRGFPDPSFASPSSGGSDRGLEDAVRGLEGLLPSAGFDAETLSRPSLLGVPVLAFASFAEIFVREDDSRICIL